ncbi:MAG: glutathione synthetase [Phaeodactylibacter sp.]|nr:glutathione synthetase [Phaeodactylibacter sp.]MCB9274260.1 glutathione synthetase [Lewinellaceae bacterium]
MKKFSVLILTDHRSHSSDNSLYALGSTLRKHRKIARVDVASRGNPANNVFFYQHQSTELQAWPLKQEMAFDSMAHRFMNHTVTVDARDYDWIWLRLPRPIPQGFFTFLDKAIGENRIFNRPSGIEATSTKAFLLNFPEWCPPMHMCHTLEDIWQAQERYPVVLKPLQSYGGQGIVKADKGFIYENRRRFTFEQYLPLLQQQLHAGGYLAMQYLRNVRQGDKRIIVVNGELIGAVLRMPPKGSWLCNAAQGGQAMEAQADERELEITRRLTDALAPRGVVMFGLDTLVDNQGRRTLSEVNTLSIGGIKPMEDITGKPVIKRVVNILTSYMAEEENQKRPNAVSSK